MVKIDVHLSEGGGLREQMNLMIRRDLTAVTCFRRALWQVSVLSPPVIEVLDVDFRYPTGPVILKDVNFGLDQTSRICIVGPNGAGVKLAVFPRLRDVLWILCG